MSTEYVNVTLHVVVKIVEKKLHDKNEPLGHFWEVLTSVTPQIEGATSKLCPFS